MNRVMSCLSRWIGGVVLPGVLSIFLVGCDRIAPRPEIKLAYVNWADATALTHVVQAVLETRFGYRVELTVADAAPVFTSVADGGHDAFVDAWLPDTHAEYMKRFQDRLVDLGPNFEGTRIGLVVPDYVPIQSIDQLRGNAASVGGKVVGIDSGAGIMSATEKAIAAYQLELKLLPSSEAAMAASLKDAIETRRPIVVTGWKPHWMFARWDLRFLDDPRGVYGTSENIHTVVRPGFVEDYPRVAEFLRRFTLTAEQLQELMEQMRARDADPEDVAFRWVEHHKELVDSWLPVATNNSQSIPSPVSAAASAPAES